MPTPPSALDPRKLREALGLTLDQLAERIGEVSVSALSRWERRDGSPSTEILHRWASALGVGKAHMGALVEWWGATP